MADLDALRESIDRLAQWMTSMVGALDRHSEQLARHERQLQLLRDEGRTQATPSEWPKEVLAALGVSTAAEALERLNSWKASYEREAALMKELHEATDTPEASGARRARPRPPLSFGMAEIDLHNSQIAPDIIRLIPREVAERCQCVPVLRIGRSNLLLATSVPLTSDAGVKVALEIERVTGFTAELLRASPQALNEALQKYYRVNDKSA